MRSILTSPLCRCHRPASFRLTPHAVPLTPGNPFDVRTLEGSHLRRLVHPGPAAELLASLATAR